MDSSFGETTFQVFEALCDEYRIPEEERLEWRLRFGAARLCEALELVEVLDLNLEEAEA